MSEVDPYYASDAQRVTISMQQARVALETFLAEIGSGETR